MSHQGKVKVLVANSCPTLCDLMDCSPPGSSVHRILYAKTLEWVAIPFSKGSSQPFGNKWSKKEKNISNLDKHYPVAFHKFCTNMYSHQQYRRGSFLSHIFAKSWYNHLLCLMLNFRVLSMVWGWFFVCFMKWAHLPFSRPTLISFLVLSKSKFSASAQTFLAWKLPQVFPAGNLLES